MTDELVKLLHQDMKDGFQHVCDRLDEMNGRVREAEQDVAVLKDRGHRSSMLWGGGSGAAIMAAIEAIKAFFKP